jgi:hypothetical protein
LSPGKATFRTAAEQWGLKVKYRRRRRFLKILASPAFYSQRKGLKRKKISIKQYQKAPTKTGNIFSQRYPLPL